MSSTVGFFIETSLVIVAESFVPHCSRRVRIPSGSGVSPIRSGIKREEFREPPGSGVAIKREEFREPLLEV